MVKLYNIGQSSKAVLIPKFIIDSLQWKDEDEYILTLEGTKLIIQKEEKRDE
jgi:antitoxin component of MazEF toxin-antitoxin module